MKALTLFNGKPISSARIAWVPTLVLFTSTAAANHHIITEAQLDAAVDRHDAIEILLPELTFLCAVVPAAVYARGTPLR